MIIQTIVIGLMMGCIYGLIAFGLSLLFGVMKIVNFAHGAIIMVGMYTVFFISTKLSIDPYIAIFIALPIVYAIGYVLGKLVEPILVREKTTGPINVLLLTLGLSLILTNLFMVIFGSDYKMVKSAIGGKTILIGDIIINIPRLSGSLISIFCFLGLYFFMKFTDLGKAMRATSQDMEAAKLMGINERAISRRSFAISAAIAAIAGVALIPFYYISHTVGDVFQLKSFIIVVLGGIGTISGSFIGGLIVGLVEALGAHFFTATYAQMIVFIIFIIILLVRPNGLFGNKE